MLLAEELVLFALDPSKGRPPLGVKERLEVASAGLLMAELALRGFAQTVDGRLFVLPGQETTASRLLDEARDILQRTDRPLKKQVEIVRHDMAPLVDRLLDELAADDVIELHDERILLKHVVRAEITDTETYDDVVVDLRDAAESDQRIPIDLAAVLAMTGPISMLEKVAPDRADRPHARDRIDHAVDSSSLLGPMVKEILDETDAVISSISATSAAVAATATPAD